MKNVDESPLAWHDKSAEQLMSLERLDDDLFAAQYNQVNANGRLFGGQVLGQSLGAAMATVERRGVHSMHCYFLRPGISDRRLVFMVERVRDGRRFSTRRVMAVQNGKPIFVMSASFFDPQNGYVHQSAMPDVPPPESLENLAQIAARNDFPEAANLAKLVDLYPIEVRPVDPGVLTKRTQIPKLQYWVRVANAASSDDPRVHQQILAYISDFWLINTALTPHRVPVPSSQLEAASLDHGMWFHRQVRTDEWMLYDTDSPSALGGISLSRGLIFQRDGTLVATTAQEALQHPLD